MIGRSEIVGKPMAMLLLAEHATVTICHSRTAGPRGTPGRLTSSSPQSDARPRDPGHGETGRDCDRRGHDRD